MIPQTGVSGASKNINWMVWRNSVIDQLSAKGAFAENGLDAWARENHAKLYVRYGIGMGPEDTAAELLETWPRPCKQDNGIKAIRDAIAQAKKSGNWNREMP